MTTLWFLFSLTYECGGGGGGGRLGAGECCIRVECYYSHVVMSLHMNQLGRDSLPGVIFAEKKIVDQKFKVILDVTCRSAWHAISSTIIVFVEPNGQYLLISTLNSNVFFQPSRQNTNLATFRRTHGASGVF